MLKHCPVVFGAWWTP